MDIESAHIEALRGFRGAFEEGFSGVVEQVRRPDIEGFCHLQECRRVGVVSFASLPPDDRIGAHPGTESKLDLGEAKPEPKAPELRSIYPNHNGHHTDFPPIFLGYSLSRVSPNPE